MPIPDKHPYDLTPADLGLELQPADMLFLLAQNIADNEPGVQSKNWLYALHDLIDALTDDEDDDALYQALAMAETREEGDVRRLLLSCIELTTSRDILYLESEDAGKSIRRQLFAIPCLLISPQGMESYVLPRNRQFNDLHRLLLDKDIFGSVDVGVANYLYDEEELWSQDYSAIRMLTDELFDVPDDAGTAPSEHLGQLNYPGHSHGGLRFLVLSVESHSDSPPSLLENFNEAMKKNVMSWMGRVQKSLGELLTQVAPDSKVSLMPPAPLFIALREGRRQIKLLEAESQLQHALEKTQLLPVEIKAIIAGYAREEGGYVARASLLEKASGQLAGLCDYPLDDMESVGSGIEALEELLLDKGVGEVVLDEELQPTDCCEGCGGPMFLMPDPQNDGTPHLTHMHKGPNTLH